MYGMKPPMMGPRMPGLTRPAAPNMPGLRRGSMPGMGARAMMPRLTGGLGYDKMLNQNIMARLKPKV